MPRIRRLFDSHVIQDFKTSADETKFYYRKANIKLVILNTVKIFNLTVLN